MDLVADREAPQGREEEPLLSDPCASRVSAEEIAIQALRRRVQDLHDCVYWDMRRRGDCSS